MFINSKNSLPYLASINSYGVLFFLDNLTYELMLENISSRKSCVIKSNEIPFGMTYLMNSWFLSQCALSVDL